MYKQGVQTIRDSEYRSIYTNILILLIMRKFLAALTFVTLLPMGNTLNAKEEKKDKQKPVKLTVFEWQFPWPPVYRLVPMDEATDGILLNEAIENVSVETESE